MSVGPPVRVREEGGKEGGRMEGEVWSCKLINTKNITSQMHYTHTYMYDRCMQSPPNYPHILPLAHVSIQLCQPIPTRHTHAVTHGTPPPHTPLPSLHSHTLSTLTLSHPHTPTNLISLIQLSKLLHFVLLQSCWHLFDVVCEDVDDLVEHCEHGLWDDLEHL